MTTEIRLTIYALATAIVLVAMIALAWPSASKPEAEIGSALTCERISPTEFSCTETFQDGSVRTWTESE